MVQTYQWIRLFFLRANFCWEIRFIVCISRQTLSYTWNVVVLDNNSKHSARNSIVSSSMSGWSHELHSSLNRSIDETVTVYNCKTAEVQGEATTRREQCGYIPTSLGLKQITLKGNGTIVHKYNTTSTQSRRAKDHLQSALKKLQVWNTEPFFNPAVT